jgi:hypothetical protein
LPVVLPHKLWLSIGGDLEFMIRVFSLFIDAIVAITGAFVNGSAININVILAGIAYNILNSILIALGRMIFMWTGISTVGFIEIFFSRPSATMILCWWALGPNYPSVFWISAWIAFSVMVGSLILACGIIFNYGCSSFNL